MDTSKNAFNGSRAMDAIIRGSEDKKKEEQYNSGSSDRCGLWSQYAQQGFVLVPDRGDPIGIFYGWICMKPTLVKTQGIRFRFSADGNTVEEVMIFGCDTPESERQLEIIHLQLTLGHRQLLRCGERIISQISVTELETEEEPAKPNRKKESQSVN